MTTPHLTQLNDDSGQTMTEYAFILAFIFIVVVVAVPAFGAMTARLFNEVMTAFGG